LRFVAETVVADELDAIAAVPVEALATGVRLGPVVLKRIDLPDVAPLLLASDQEKVPRMADWPSGFSEVPLVPVLERENLSTMAGWIPEVVVFPLVSIAALPCRDARFVRAFVFVATERPSSAALTPLVGPLAECGPVEFAVNGWVFCKAFERLCSLVLVLVLFAVEDRGWL
jgi:hypothetical protein